jgi:hypothetical protein
MDSKLRLKSRHEAAAPPPQQAKPGAKIDISKQLHKTKMCMHFLKGKCRYGPECSYAHSEIELKGRPNLRKTRLCKNYEMGQCDNPHCPFAHGGEELRGTDGVWKTVMCAKWLNGTCRAGSRCRFAHGQHELQDPPIESFDILDDEDGEFSPPISPAFYPSPMPMNVPGLPYHENPTPTSYDSTVSTQPESFSHIAMASLMHAMSTLETEPTVDSPANLNSAGVSPTHSERAEPPPVPTKWNLPKTCPPVQRVEENHRLGDATTHATRHAADPKTAKPPHEDFKSTPQRGRPSRPLSPLTPTALNCLPSGLFSPGSLPMPKHLLAEASW